MSTYAIGDVQGCFTELRRLLDKINYDPGADHLWFTGDLINRGPDNAGVLDLIMGLPNVISVLGNHDLHFLGVAGGGRPHQGGDTLDDLLQSEKKEEYVDFLRRLPLLHHDAANNRLLVHAGLPPQLPTDLCLALAGEVESILRGPDCAAFLAAMYGNEPARRDAGLAGMDRLRLATNYFTRMRYCTRDGALELTRKGRVPPEGYAPWFSFGRSDGVRVLFGHWAALNGQTNTAFAVPLDTGCVWGGRLTALRLEDGAFIAVKAGCRI